jgi:hypothetical protein
MNYDVLCLSLFLLSLPVAVDVLEIKSSTGIVIFELLPFTVQSTPFAVVAVKGHRRMSTYHDEDNGRRQIFLLLPYKVFTPLKFHGAVKFLVVGAVAALWECGNEYR